MITVRARALTGLIEENASLEQKIEQSEAFRETAAALVEVKLQIVALVLRYQRVADRLEVRTRTDLVRTLEEIKTILHDVGQELRKTPRQSGEVKRVGARIQAASKRLDDAWREFVKGQLRSHQEVLGLVGSLPEIANQRGDIEATINRALSLAESVPADDDSLRCFEQAMEWLAAVLKEIEGVSATIRDFLEKVVDGRATFADLNSEIMTWIADRDRARAFQIRFGQAAGQRAL